MSETLARYLQRTTAATARQRRDYAERVCEWVRSNPGQVPPDDVVDWAVLGLGEGEGE